MPIIVTMPALSPTMEEGTLTKWLVETGDSVSSGDIIAEIETDKATMEVESIDDGTVAKLLVSEGTENVAVNSVIAVLAEEGEDTSSIDFDSIGKEARSVKNQHNDATDRAIEPVRASSTKPNRTKQAEISPNRIKASPLAKRIAREQNVNLAGLDGSGPKGRIIKKDVERAAHSVRPTEKTATTPDSFIAPQVLDDRVYPPESYTLEPLDGVRKTVARRLALSFMQVPHFPLSIDLQIDHLLSVRQDLNRAAPEGVKISVNDLLIKACAHALIDEPDCNASYTDNGIAYHKSAHVSVAVAIPGGLMTPVIFDAENKKLSQISTEMKDLAERARNRRLKPQEYMGGTFSLSNLGMYGIKSFGSIINPPEGMILSVGAGDKQPIFGEDGELIKATIMSVTLTCDHRVIGGAEGAKWLQVFKRYVEKPEIMLL